MELQLAIANLNLGQKISIVDSEEETKPEMVNRLAEEHIMLIETYHNDADCDPRAFFRETKDWVQDTKKNWKHKRKKNKR